MDTNEVKKFIQELIGQEDLICLGDIAEIRRPHRYPGTGKNLGGYEYPIDYSKLKEWALTDWQVQKYDIILPHGNFRMVYMVDEDPKEVIYHKDMSVVLRPNGKLQPEYMYLFLKSQTGQELMSCFTSACGPHTLSVRQVRELYIPLPTLSETEYRRTFEIENHYQLDMATYNDLIANWQDEERKSIAAVFNSECLDTILQHKANAFVEMVKQDIEELKLCFHAKAYKATLIMAGSVLEAVLLDWLSDIHQKNYFKQDFMVTKINDKGEEYQVRGNLVNYIEAIKHIEAPDWMDGADWSDAIRRKRNLVHAKLGIKTKDINKESCEMVIGYLEKVIQTRAERM